MPVYSYINDSTGEVKDILQKMVEPHVYEENGVKWRRLFTKPEASIDARVNNEFSSKEFAEKTGRKRGTMKDLQDQARELSEKREKRAGKDQVFEAYKKDWSKKRNGRAFPEFARR